MGMRQTDERISQKADRLHLTFLRDHLSEVLESIMAANMTTREAFDFAFGKEIEQREINRFKQALQAAHFPCIKRLEDFDFSAQPSIAFASRFNQTTEMNCAASCMILVSVLRTTR